MNPTPTGDQIAKLINDTVDDLESYMKENDQLREQLDAVVEALEKHDERTCDYKDWVELRKAALAKLKQ